MKYLQKTFTIGKIERLNNSYYGNPRYMVWLEDEQGVTMVAKTTPNSEAGYVVKSNTTKLCKYHITKSGNVLIDYIFA